MASNKAREMFGEMLHNIIALEYSLLVNQDCTQAQLHASELQERLLDLQYQLKLELDLQHNKEL